MGKDTQAVKPFQKLENVKRILLTSMPSLKTTTLFGQESIFFILRLKRPHKPDSSRIFENLSASGLARTNPILYNVKSASENSVKA
eukprot:3389208-Rhodomonas_salina.3